MYDQWLSNKSLCAFVMQRQVDEKICRYAFMPSQDSDTGILYIDVCGIQDAIIHASVFIDSSTKQLYLHKVYGWTEVYDHEHGSQVVYGSKKLLKRLLPKENLNEWVHTFFGEQWHMHIQFNLGKTHNRLIKRVSKSLPLPADVSAKIVAMTFKWEAENVQKIENYVLMSNEYYYMSPGDQQIIMF